MTTLAKYEAVGNDFLVLIDPPRAEAVEAGFVTAACDRRRGVGADGLLRVSLAGHGSGAALSMELWNADGGTAETSGNGLRCAVLAAAHGGLVSEAALLDGIAVATGAGVSGVRLVGALGGLAADLAVEMGACVVTAEDDSPLAGWRAFLVDVGNPHLVLVAESATAPAAELASVGPRLQHSRPGGVNVELVTVGPRPGELGLEVFERGAGITLACGSGSSAAAAACRSVDLVGDDVVVHNPGGRLHVALSGARDRPLATLSGPARKVADVMMAASFVLQEAAR